jgi:hypothetical protein
LTLRSGLLEEIVGSQHHRSFSLAWPFEELSRCSLLNRIAQPHKLIYSLIRLHIMLTFKIVHRRGADRTPHCLALIKHREINDHPIEVVAQYFTSRQQHCKSSVLKGSDYRALTAAHSDLMESRFVKPAAMAGVLRSVLWIRTKLRYIAIAGTLSEAIRHLQVAE